MLHLWGLSSRSTSSPDHSSHGDWTRVVFVHGLRGPLASLLCACPTLSRLGTAFSCHPWNCVGSQLLYFQAVSLWICVGANPHRLQPPSLLCHFLVAKLPSAPLLRPMLLSWRHPAENNLVSELQGLLLWGQVAPSCSAFPRPSSSKEWYILSVLHQNTTQSQGNGL